MEKCNDDDVNNNNMHSLPTWLKYKLVIHYCNVKENTS